MTRSWRSSHPVALVKVRSIAAPRTAPSYVTQPPGYREGSLEGRTGEGVTRRNPKEGRVKSGYLKRDSGPLRSVLKEGLLDPEFRGHVQPVLFFQVPPETYPQRTVTPGGSSRAERSGTRSNPTGGWTDSRRSRTTRDPRRRFHDSSAFSTPDPPLHYRSFFHSRTASHVPPSAPRAWVGPPPGGPLSRVPRDSCPGSS